MIWVFPQPGRVQRTWYSCEGMGIGVFAGQWKVAWIDDGNGTIVAARKWSCGSE